MQHIANKIISLAALGTFFIIATLSLNMNSFAQSSKSKDSEFRQRLSDYFVRKINVKVNLNEFAHYPYKGIEFYFLGNNANVVSEMKNYIHTTIDKMQYEITNPKVWRAYARNPYVIVVDTKYKVSGGGSASYKNEVIYAYYEKVRVAKNRFSAVIPHELGHHLYRDNPNFENFMVNAYQKYLKRKLINSKEQETDSEFFCNTTEAYLYWSNESFPVNRNDLKTKMSDVYSFLDSVYKK